MVDVLEGNLLVVVVQLPLDLLDDQLPLDLAHSLLCVRLRHCVSPEDMTLVEASPEALPEGDLGHVWQSPLSGKA